MPFAKLAVMAATPPGSFYTPALADPLFDVAP
jgi:hypothetical protein